MWHSEISKSPCKHGNNVKQWICLLCSGYRIICSKHGQISRKRSCVVCNSLDSTCCTDSEYENDHKCDRHDNTLDKVCSRRCQKSSKCGISNNNQCTDDHSRKIIYTKKAGKKFTAGCESGSCVRNKKDNDKNRSDRLQDLLLISVSITKKRWQCDGVSCHMSVATYPLSHDFPVYVGSDSKANSCPACICNTGKISKSR